MLKTELSNIEQKLLSRHISAIGCLVSISLLSSFTDTHHPSVLNWFDGFMGGLAHPVLGLDHLVTILAIGLISAGIVRGALIPAAFVLATLLGMLNHLLHLHVPGAEIAIAFSTIVFAAILLSPNRPNVLMLILLAASAGLFHGYTYTEAVLSATMPAQVTYMLGFTLTQYVVAMSAREIGNIISMGIKSIVPNFIRFTAFSLCAFGIVFLGNSMI